MNELDLTNTQAVISCDNPEELRVYEAKERGE